MVNRVGPTLALTPPSCCCEQQPRPRLQEHLQESSLVRVLWGHFLYLIPASNNKSSPTGIPGTQPRLGTPAAAVFTYILAFIQRLDSQPDGGFPGGFQPKRTIQEGTLFQHWFWVEPCSSISEESVTLARTLPFASPP